MAFSEQEKIEEFQRLRDFLDSVEIAAEVVPKSSLSEEPTLLVCLPGGEEIAEEEEPTVEKLHVAAGYLLDFDETEQRLAKYLLFYTQIAVDLSAMKVEEVLLLLNELNRTVRVGHYFLGSPEKNGPQIVQYRATVTGVDGEPFDEGIVADTILEMGVGYETAKDALLMANEECKNRG